jgi:hypothetical protein
MRLSKSTLGLIFTTMCTATIAHAQVPANIEEGLKKIGQIVDPACTAKLYRPLMPKNDYNTYWPPDAEAPASKAQLYPGITIARDTSFASDPKDVLDIFTADKGGDNRPVLIYVPGGAGNKIEQQAREGERLLRQHRTMGDEERDGAACSYSDTRARQLGRRRARHREGGGLAH